MKLLMIDVDSLFDLKSFWTRPTCSLERCDRRDGDWRRVDGTCGRQSWCLHARHSPVVEQQRRDGRRVQAERVWAAVPWALEKLFGSGWQVVVWTTRPRCQFYRFVRVLSATPVWSLLQMLAGTPTVLYMPETKDQLTSAATLKLMLYERIRASLPHVTQTVLVEADPWEGMIIQAYVGDQVRVHRAPTFWFELLAIDFLYLDSFLVRGASEVDLSGFGQPMVEKVG